MTDIESFLQTVMSIAQGNAIAIATRENDALGELEVNALMAAAHAFATYQQVRAVRAAADERAAVESVN